MRIASTQYHSTMNRALHDVSGKVENVMQQMASGMRLLQPSDDPVTSVRLSRLTREEAVLTQYRENIAALDSRMRRNESYLQGMTNDIMQARDLLVWAANGSNTSADINAMAGSLQSLRDSLFYASNTKDQEGRYLFSGTAANTATVSHDPAAAVGARYTFTGNTGAQNVVVGNGVTHAGNVTLPDVMTLLNQLDRAIAVMQAPGADINDPASRAEVTGALDGLDVALGSMTSKIAGLGGAQNVLETLQNNHANVSLSNKQAFIVLGQLDYGDAAVKLNGYTAALQSTQKAYARISGLSLFNVL